jgi:hypothetical protein
MNKCSICEATNITTNNEKVIDGQKVLMVYQDDYCVSCRGLVNHYTRIKKLSFTDAVNKVLSQVSWLHKSPMINNKVFCGY